MPYIVRQCVEEIERRGMEEVGIYRVSGVATDIQALKAAFDVSECQPQRVRAEIWVASSCSLLLCTLSLHPGMYYYLFVCEEDFMDLALAYNAMSIMQQ